MTVCEIENILKASLKPNRFIHSLGVANTARELAKIYGADEDKAYLAGILHDCEKNKSDSELLNLIDEYGLTIDDVSKKSPQLLHSFAGAETAKRFFGVDDTEIYDAIYRHTIGGADMPLLTEIIYLADGIEPSRSYEGVEKIRETSKIDLHKAVVMYTRSTADYVKRNGLLLHPAAEETIKFYTGK